MSDITWFIPDNLSGPTKIIFRLENTSNIDYFVTTLLKIQSVN